MLLQPAANKGFLSQEMTYAKPWKARIRHRYKSVILTTKGESFLIARNN